MPCTNERLNSQPLKLNGVRKKLSANRERQKKFHDRSAKHLSSLEKGDKVCVQIFDKLWKPAVITDQHSNRSYILHIHDGNVYRRNRKFIHKSKDQTFEDSDLMSLLKSQEKSCELSGIPMSQAHSEITELPQLITSREINPPSKLDSDSYITRSGRKVIPNKYLSDPVWHKYF